MQARDCERWLTKGNFAGIVKANPALRKGFCDPDTNKTHAKYQPEISIFSLVFFIFACGFYWQLKNVYFTAAFSSGVFFPGQKAGDLQCQYSGPAFLDNKKPDTYYKIKFKCC
jgi:hypothetical protein